MSIFLTIAEWDKRPKTKFIRIEGSVQVNSFTAEIEVRLSDSPPLNKDILLLELVVLNDEGPRKIQTKPFFFTHATIGDEGWKYVEIFGNEDSSIMPITTLAYA